MKTLEGMSVDEYETAIDRFIEKAAQWDGALPVETFFATWKALESRRSPVEIQAHIKDDHLVLAAPPGCPLRVRDDRIWLEDGRQVVIRLA
jgi:hypothetical protein